MFDDEAEAFVNTVNCVGVMGRGVALQFKQRFPENFKEYAKACKLGMVVPGRMFVYDSAQMLGPRWIINFPTKRHWRGASRIEDIVSGLDDFVGQIVRLKVKSVVLPPLGCGLGGLDWQVVKPLIAKKLSALPDVRFIVHEPDSTAATYVHNVKVPKMTPGRAALVMLASGYLAALLEPFVSLLEMHKLMYFLQEAGEPLRLRYVKGPYGPYAENLGHVFLDVEGHLFSGYENDGDKPWDELSLVPGAHAEAEQFLRSHPQTHGRIARVLQLADGFETTEGMELLGSVHWVCTREGAASKESAVKLVHSWNLRKSSFTARQVGLAYAQLQRQGWI